MSEFNSMELAKEQAVDNWDDIPEQRGQQLPLLPRGTYEFQFPHNLTKDKWVTSTYEDGKKKDAEGKALVHTYARVNFDADLPLVVVRDTTAEQSWKDQLFRGSISTMKRNRAKKGEPEKMVSDALYLYKDGLKGPKIKTDVELVDGICKLGAGKTFIADVTWPAFCNKKKIRYVADANGQIVEDPEKKMGCGQNYYDGQCPAERFSCKCGAQLRVFPELARYRAPEPEQAAETK